MGGHEILSVTSNLKVNCSICYITIVILDLGYVEIDTEIFFIAQIRAEIWKLILKNATFHVTLNLKVTR